MHFKIRPRIRVVGDDGTIALGPGKADLLEAIAKTGSIRAAASQLRMSYMRAWTLVRVMNGAFRSPLVAKIRGGSDQGGAQLTRRGKAVLDIYRRMEDQAEDAVASAFRDLKRHL
ncbi:MAG TPA: LysR family transcriptional regulator [Thermoanaerobaculia bacterium]|nr:LysR family transcriptional regulator [Thermoanaerobaculia bacterium]